MGGCCCEPEMDKGTIQVPLLKKNISGQEKMIPDEEGKNAITEFEVLQRMGGVLTLVALYPLTGRTHQLRAHMEYIKTPISYVMVSMGAKNHLYQMKIIQKKCIYTARLIDMGKINIVADISGHMLETFKMFNVVQQKYFDEVFNNL